MPSIALLPALLVVALIAAPVHPDESLKKEAVKTVDAHRDALVSLSDQVWRLAETALKETRSSALLADFAEQHGFRVTRGVGGLPTAFVAEYGDSAPVIAVMGEYDALPGISQKARPAKAPFAEGAGGHGCGHNLFGAGSLGAALAVKQLIEAGKIEGTVRFYGTPAEEAVGGKIYMARAGAFEDVDVMLAWHPSVTTRADTVSTQAIVDLAVEFEGRTAHAASDPWNARSAADGAEAFTHGINLLREHVKPSVRLHYVVQSAGDVPNVVPDHARVWIWVRDWTRDGVEDVLARVRQIGEGAALVANVTHTITVQGGDYELLVNQAGAKALDANLRWLGELQYTDEEQAFARELQRQAGVEPTGMTPEIVPLEGQEPEGGSTDVGDVSWIVPTLHVSVTTAPDVPWHAWPVVAASGMSIGHKGMLQAAKVLAATMVDLFANDRLRTEVREEFADQTEGFTYEPYIPPGPPMVP